MAKSGKSYNGKTYSTNNFSAANFYFDRIMDKNVFYKNNIKSLITEYNKVLDIYNKALNKLNDINNKSDNLDKSFMRLLLNTAFSFNKPQKNDPDSSRDNPISTRMREVVASTKAILAPNLNLPSQT